MDNMMVAVAFTGFIAWLYYSNSIRKDEDS